MNARLRANVLRFTAPQPVPKPVRWGNLPKPIHAADTRCLELAKSMLVALVGHVDLTPEQARDVCEWGRHEQP